MAQVQRTITIQAPVDKVFGYIDDPTHELEWLPSLIESRDVTGTGVGKHWRWAYKMVGLRFQGESTYTEYVPGKRIVYQSKGGHRQHLDVRA